MENNRRTEQYFKLHKDGFYIDDITANDINFDAVFDKTNNTVSSLGEELLYFVLRKPKLSLKQIGEFEKNVEYFGNDADNAAKVRKQLSSLSKLNKISVFEYLEYLDRIEKKSIPQLFLPIIGFLLVISVFNFNATAAILLLVALFCVNTIAYFKLLKNIKPYIVCFAYIIKAIKTAEKIDEIDSKEYALFSGIKRFSFLFGNMTGATAHGGAGSPLDMILDLLKMTFHFDIIRFYFMVDKVKANKSQIISLLEHIGMLDVYLSVLEYRKSLSYYCIPEFVLGLHYDCTDAYHPLIDNPVPNSIYTSRSILLTGSNASGKSTFLRTVLINSMLAQGINTCLCKKYEAPFFLICSSMSVSDNVMSGDSFYMAEIKSVKRIFDLLETYNDEYVLCVVDELLKGTNTIERIASSSTVLEKLDSAHCLTFAATHDIELTNILEKQYFNYHFSEDVDLNDISFSYKLKEGPSKTTNAIKLLTYLDFPSEIVDESTSKVMSFKHNGKWCN